MPEEEQLFPTGVGLPSNGKINLNLNVEIPDDLVGQLNAAGGDLSRRALEALALEEYKSGHLTEDELRRLLGFGSRYQLDGFLKAHGVWIEYTVEDFRREVDSLEQLGL
jgi:predicted HTH domain antitoxin